MNAGFSFHEVLGSGVALIRRRPRTVLGWGAVMALPVLIMGWIWLGMMGTMDATLLAAEHDLMPFVLMMQYQVGLQMLNLVTMLLYVVLMAAIFRAVVYPDRRSRFLDLRVGMDEVRVLVAGAAIFLGFYIAIIVVALLGVAAGASFWTLSKPLAIGIGVLIGVAGFVGGIWALLRASMIAPASIILRDFAFVQGWKLTKGQVLPLLGLNLAVMIITMAVQTLFVVLVLMLVVAVVMGLAGWAGMAEAIHAWSVAAEGATTFAVNWPLAIGLSVLAFPVLAAFYGATYAFCWAPQASACQQLLAQTRRDDARPDALG